MAERIVKLPWSSDEIAIKLPARWSIAGILEPQVLPVVPDVEAAVRDSLQQPIGLPQLREMVSRKPELAIALVIDDSSRPTPVAQILPAVLAELEQAGVRRGQMTLIPAIGLHRAMNADEIAQRVGCAALMGLQRVTHACDDMAHLTHLGHTSRGTPVYVNDTVTRSDLVISIGCIEPHIIASFGGGYKNLVPGLAGRITVAHNHSLNCSPATFNMVGQSIDNNPMRLDLEEAGRKLKPPVFIVNTVLNNSQQVVRVVTGDPVAAHRAGVATSEKMYGVHIDRPADIVISDSHPMDQDLRQGVKALANTVRGVRVGGIHITLVRAAEGVGVFGLANRKLPLGRQGLRILAPLLLPLVSKIKLQGLGEEDRFFLYFALQAMRHARLVMYAPTIPAETKSHLPFVEFCDNQDAAIDVASRRFPQQAEVLIFPHGGITYPVIKN